MREADFGVKIGISELVEIGTKSEISRTSKASYTANVAGYFIVSTVNHIKIRAT